MNAIRWIAATLFTSVLACSGATVEEPTFKTSEAISLPTEYQASPTNDWVDMPSSDTNFCAIVGLLGDFTATGSDEPYAVLVKSPWGAPHYALEADPSAPGNPTILGACVPWSNWGTKATNGTQNDGWGNYCVQAPTGRVQTTNIDTNAGTGLYRTGLPLWDGLKTISGSSITTYANDGHVGDGVQNWNGTIQTRIHVASNGGTMSTCGGEMQLLNGSTPVAIPAGDGLGLTTTSGYDLGSMSQEFCWVTSCTGSFSQGSSSSIGCLIQGFPDGHGGVEQYAEVRGDGMRGTFMCAPYSW